jgi:hypothetical protein
MVQTTVHFARQQNSGSVKSKLFDTSGNKLLTVDCCMKLARGTHTHTHVQKHANTHVRNFLHEEQVGDVQATNEV